MPQEKKKFYQTEAFSDLNDQWQKRLEESGFKDIERSINGDSVLIDYDAHRFGRTDRLDPLTVENRTAYYRLAGQFLHTYKFKNKTETWVWKLHAEGLSRRLIIQQLKSVRIHVKDHTVKEIIHRLAAVMRTENRLSEDDDSE